MKKFNCIVLASALIISIPAFGANHLNEGLNLRIARHCLFNLNPFILNDSDSKEWNHGIFSAQVGIPLITSFFIQDNLLEGRCIKTSEDSHTHRTYKHTTHIKYESNPTPQLIFTP